MAESQATSRGWRPPAPPAARPAPVPGDASGGHPPGKGPDLVDRGIDAVGRGVARLGKAAGRALGRTREIDPAHRRDGLGVALIVLAVVSAAGIWFGAGGPVGRGISAGIGYVVGRGAVVLPVLLAVAGVVLMATEPRPDSRPRVALGGFLLALGVLGLVHLAAHRPDDPALWPNGGGAIGYVAATPLATGLTAWVAAPVLAAAGVLRGAAAHGHARAGGARPRAAAARPRARRRPTRRDEDSTDPVAEAEAEPVALRRPVADAARPPSPTSTGRPSPTPSRRPSRSKRRPHPHAVPRSPFRSRRPSPSPTARWASSCGSPCSPPPTARSTSCRPATSCPPARCRSAAAAPTTR